MPFQVTCKSCGHTLSLPDHARGMTYSCPQCRANQEAVETPSEPQLQGSQWFATVNGQQYGPYSTGRVASFIGGGMVRPDTLLWREGFDDWLPASRVPEFEDALQAANTVDTAEFIAVPAPAPPEHAPEPPAPSGSARLAYRRIKAESERSALKTALYLVGGLVALGGIVAAVIIVNSRKEPAPKPPVEYKVVHVRREPEPRPEPKPKATPKRPRTGLPGDEWEGADEATRTEALYGDDALGDVLGGDTDLTELPDFKIAYKGETVNLPDLWPRYQSALEAYEATVSELKLVEEEMQNIGLPTETPRDEKKDADDEKYRAARKALEARRHKQIARARREFELAVSAYADAKAAMKKGGSKLKYTRARQRAAKAAYNKRKVLYYDLEADKKWTDLVAEIKDEIYGDKDADLPEDHKRLKAEYEAVRGRTDEAQARLASFNTSFENDQLKLLAAGIVRINCRYAVRDGRVAVSGGRWINVVPGSAEYRRFVNREAIEIAAQADELKAFRKPAEAAIMRKLITKRFPGAEIPE